MTENRHIMLYWDDERHDASIDSVTEKWRATCPSWEVRLFSRQSAHQFIQREFGGDIARSFILCALPAMRSDFFRVFWALHFGGIYSDFTFSPRREPFFFNEEKNITLPRWRHGRIVNGFFFAKRDCQELKAVAYEILKSTSRKTDNNVWSATGPGAWIRALGNEETDTIGVIHRSQLFAQYLEGSTYTSSTRGTDRHWSELQKHMSIYGESSSDLGPDERTSPRPDGTG